MKPLSPLKRRLYFIALTMLFFVVVPSAFLFAGGWRYKEGFGLVQTGGIFVSVPFSDAVISLDGAPVGESNFLNHHLYISNLAPSAYVVHVEKKGYHPWSKVLVVEPQLVTDAEAFLIPDEIQVTKLVVGSAATSTRAVSHAQYAAFTAAFSASLASSTAQDVMRRSTAIVIENDDVAVRWTEPGTHQPSAFCGRPSYCVDTIPIERTKQKAISAFFFSRGVVYATQEGGVFFSEVDVRPTVSAGALFPHADADARIVDGALIVKYEEDFYQVDGL